MKSVSSKGTQSSLIYFKKVFVAGAIAAVLGVICKSVGFMGFSYLFSGICGFFGSAAACSSEPSRVWSILAALAIGIYYVSFVVGPVLLSRLLRRDGIPNSGNIAFLTYFVLVLLSNVAHLAVGYGFYPSGFQWQGTVLEIAAFLGMLLVMGALTYIPARLQH